MLNDNNLDIVAVLNFFRSFDTNMSRLRPVMTPSLIQTFCINFSRGINSPKLPVIEKALKSRIYTHLHFFLQFIYNER